MPAKRPPQTGKAHAARAKAKARPGPAPVPAKTQQRKGMLQMGETQKKTTGPSSSRAKPASKPLGAARKPQPRLRVDYLPNSPETPAQRLRNAQAAAAASPSGAMVLVYSPSCGHCMNMRPAWELAADEVTSRGYATVIDVDAYVLGEAARQQPSMPLVRALTDEGYRGVPHIVFVGGPSGGTTQYHGDRTAQDLARFAASGGGRR